MSLGSELTIPTLKTDGPTELSPPDYLAKLGANRKNLVRVFHDDMAHLREHKAPPDPVE